MLKPAAILAMGLCWVGSSAAVNFTADPDPGTMVSELSSVTLTFPDASVVDMGSQYQNVTITRPDFSISCTLDYGAEENQMVISFSRITEAGTYTIEVPEDAITADGTAVEAFTITYNIGTEQPKNATLIPAPGDVEWLYELTFSDPDIAVNLNVNSTAEEKPTLTSPSGEITELYAVYDYQVGEGKYRFRLRQLANEPGTYKVSFPENYISYYDTSTYTSVYLPAYEFTYEVKGGQLTQVVSDPSISKPTTNFNFLNLEFPGYSTVKVPELSYTDASVPVYMEGSATSAATVMLTNFVAQGNRLSYSNQYSDCITPGHYFLTIPQGSVLLGEEEAPCTPFMVEFDVVAPKAAAIEISPANGSTVSMLNKAIVTFPELDEVELARSPSLNLAKVTLDGDAEKLTTIGGAYSQTAFERLSGNSFLATFNGIATVDGDYRLTLATNSFEYAGGYNQEYSVDVKFVAPEAPAFEMTPDNLEPLAKLQKFTITFPQESVVKLNSALNSKITVLYKGDEITYTDYGYIANSQVGTTSAYNAVEGSSNSFSFTLSSAGLDEGKYVLRIPAGIFLMGEDETNFNGLIDVVYECNGEGIDKIEVNPSKPVKELSEISIKFINETSVSLQTPYTGFSLNKEVEGQSWGQYIDYLSGENVRVEGNTLYLTISKPITEEGKYYIEISAYSLFMSDSETTSTPQTVYFTVDPNAEPVSVGTIASDLNDGRIFTITGLEVKEMKVPGIYIVNGKKVAVK